MMMKECGAVVYSVMVVFGLFGSGWTGVHAADGMLGPPASISNKSTQQQGEYLEGYPFRGPVLGAISVSPCTNYTEMYQNFEFYDPDEPTGDTIELTNAINYTQIGSFPTPGYAFDDLPPSDELVPWVGDEEVLTKSPGYLTKCWNRTSGLTTIDCQEDCLVYYNLFNATWLNFGSLYCMNSYPTPNLTSLESPLPTPGNLSVILTNQCGQYEYGPSSDQDNVTISILTDPWENVYALQSSTESPTTQEDWEALVNNVTFPPGWVLGERVLTEIEEHYSYIIGQDCWIVILKDSEGNAWHQYVYTEPLEQSSLLASFDCPALALTPEDIISSGEIDLGPFNDDDDEQEQEQEQEQQEQSSALQSGTRRLSSLVIDITVVASSLLALVWTNV